MVDLPTDKIREARESGAVQIHDSDGDFIIVVPGARGSSAPRPFDAKSQPLLSLPTQRPAYSDRTAWLMAEISQLAYRPFERGPAEQTELAKSLADAKMLIVSIISAPDTGTQCFIAYRKEAFAVLAFRGTEKNRKDIISDLDARFLKTPEGKSHCGFQRAFNSVKSQIEDALANLPKDMPIYVCGHSLGGALATIATQILEETNKNITATYTFGSPRVGTAEWSDAVKTPIYRVVNGADIVPTVPLGIIGKFFLFTLAKLPFFGWLGKLIQRGFAGYQHAGDERFLLGPRENPQLKIGRAAVFSRIQHVIIGLIWTAICMRNVKILSAGFSDHSIGLYADKLRAIAIKRNPRLTA